MAASYPALAIHTEGEGPLKLFGEAQALKLQQQQIQTQEQAFQDRQSLTKAMINWDGKDYNTIPGLVGKAGGSGNAQLQAQQMVLGLREKAANIAKDDSITNQNKTETAIKTQDELRGRLMNIVGISDPVARQSAWEAEVAKEEAAQTIQPGQVSKQYPGDAQALSLANGFALGSTLVKEQQERQKLSLEAWKPIAGSLQNVITGETIGGLNGQKIAQLNKGFETRWQVLHPGEPLPDEFKLPADAKVSDFDHLDKILEATERATGTKAQQDTANAMRAQTFEMLREKTDMQAVVGVDPKTGNQVLVPAGQAQQMGIQNPMKAGEDQVNKALAARHWITLATKPGAPGAAPEDLSITQLIDHLDKSGDLGVVASRWNDFMAGKVGAGNPYVSALRTKMGLSTTLLMQAHVGNRGSSQMLEHFEDLANQKKLDGPTLKAAFNSEVSYVRDRAMDPNPPDYSKPGKPMREVGPPAGATGIAPGSDGHKHYHDAQGKDLGIAP